MSGTVSATCTYNAHRQRTSKTVNGQTTYYLYNQSGQLLAELDHSGQTMVEYVWLGTQPLAMIHSGRASAVVYYLHTDHHNTPQVVSDNQGTVVWRADYDAFGQATVASGSPLTFNLRFPGQYFDSETGLHYNYYRDYDPSTGRYIQSDPIGLQGGLNTYAYVGGNPLRFTDPLGLAYSPVGEHGVSRDSVSGKQECTIENPDKCISQCLRSLYGTSYEVASALSPFSLPSVAASEFAEAVEDHAGKQATRNMYSSRYTTGVRQMSAAKFLGRFSLAEAFAGVGGGSFQLAAYMNCAIRCSGNK